MNQWARLNHAIGLAYQVNENIVIFGDLNSDVLSLNNNKLIDMMRLFNLKNVIEKPTNSESIHSGRYVLHKRKE
jgi:hypothetical protein